MAPLSLAKSIAARMLGRKLGRTVISVVATPRQRPASAKPAPGTGTEPPRTPKRAPRPAQAALPPRSEPDIRELVEAFAPPPVTPPPPPPVLKSGWRGSCTAINPDTGRQCCLLAGHTKLHRHGATEFLLSAAPGQTHFRRRAALDELAARRNGVASVETERPSVSKANAEQYQRRLARAHDGANTTTGNPTIDRSTPTPEAA